MAHACRQARRQTWGVGLPGSLVLAILLTLAVPVFAGTARAQDAGAQSKVHLFTVVSARDEIVIGLSETEIPALAGRTRVTVVADLLASDGRLSAWRYGPARGEDGVIRQIPVHLVAIFAAGTIRLEPYVSEQEVIPPAR